ncbi:AMP-binding protein [Pelagerythrobacter sp.]|uniref:AMP-binding protein n=1 Tax=Pelagerythrobacter sp. TaxID=2800702 RepID=UPI0035B301A2
MNVFNLLLTTARRFPGHAGVCVGHDIFLTYSGLLDRSLRLATALRESAEAGDRVLIAAGNCPEYVEILFGCWAAGLVAVPVNAKLHAREIAQIVEDCGPRHIFASESLQGALREKCGDAAITIIGSADYLAAIERAAPAIPHDTGPDDTAWLFFTSGTTGRSKGAMLTHRNLLAMSCSHLADFDDPDENASLIHAAPMSHGSGLYIVPYVARGARQVVPASGGFDPMEFVDLCNVHGDCAAFMAPTMVQRLRQACERESVRPANLRTLVYGGAPMYLDEIRRSLKTFGPILVQLYGQGEAPMTITGLRKRDHLNASDRVLTSAGWPRTGVEVAVFTGDGTPAEAGETGEIACRGDVVMAGYSGLEQATAETLRGGWLFTGDVGSIDETGMLTLHDRSKDVIISGGSNIYPREVEDVLMSHPSVAEVAVLGLPHDDWGEIVVAVVVSSAAAAPPDEAQLDAHCLEHIARFKRPKRYVFQDGLPRNSYGKVSKNDLRLAIGPAM